MEYHITLPSKPRIVSEEGNSGVYEIDSLYPGYGHTLGNSLRRIVLSSLPGAAITHVKIDDVPHEFSTIEGVKEDVLGILLNLKKVHFSMTTDEPQVVTLRATGPGIITAKDLSLPGQVSIANTDQHIAELAPKGKLSIECTVERGLGYVPREVLSKEKVDIGTIALDATFTPIRRAHYEVENMRVGDRTDFNRLRFTIETNGTVSPREALEESITTMIQQLKAIVGFKEEVVEEVVEHTTPSDQRDETATEEPSDEVLKTRIDDLPLSSRIASALGEANIRTVGGLVRKSADDLLSLEGVGEKAVAEIEASLKDLGVSLKVKAS